MKQKIIIRFYTFISILVFLTIASSCEKDDKTTSGNSTNGKTTAIFNPDKTYGTLIDIDGNEYKTITIGNQVWMAENLRTKHYQNGDAIPEVKDNRVWMNISSGAYCNYKYSKNIDTIATFGRLYNWYAVSDSRNIAPKGWHVPSSDDWYFLEAYLGRDSVAIQLKEIDSIHWSSENTEATNKSGFTALPGGSLYTNGEFQFIGEQGFWWTSTECLSSSYAFRKGIYSSFQYVFMDFSYKEYGFSVRCIKD